MEQKQRLCLYIANKAFADKTDKAGKPYIEHLTRVRDRVAAWGFDEDIQCSALLHDLLEDCPEWDIETLRGAVGDRVAGIVGILTKRPGMSYEKYIFGVSLSERASVIKLADLLDNMDITRLPELTEKDIERRRKYRQALDYLLGAWPRFSQFV